MAHRPQRATIQRNSPSSFERRCWIRCQVSSPGGESQVSSPGGKVEYRLPEGKVKHRLPEWKVKYRLPEGKVKYRLQEGKVKYRLPEGTIRSRSVVASSSGRPDDAIAHRPLRETMLDPYVVGLKLPLGTLFP